MNRRREKVWLVLNHGLLLVVPDHKTAGIIPYGPRVKKALCLAVQEAQALHHTYIGTEHIFSDCLPKAKAWLPTPFQTWVLHSRPSA